MSDLYKDSLPAPFKTAQVTVGTSIVQLVSVNSEPKTGVTIKADSANGGKVYIGGSNGVATTTGFELVAGDSVTIPIEDVSKIWAIADAVSQSVHLLWI